MTKNKVVLVTGAGQGIGRGIAHQFAQKGYSVVVSDIDSRTAKETAKEIENLGGKALAVVADVSNKKQVEKMILATVKKFGSLDVLINNAGIFPFVSFDKMTEKDWDKVFNVNLKSIFLTVQSALKYLREGGRIINITSIAAHVGFSGLTHYCASKGAIESFSRALSLELAGKKITVNNVAPGAIETSGATKTSTKELQKQTIAMIPLQRMGQPQDIAGACLFLASEEASYITGQTIIVDGGWTLR